MDLFFSIVQKMTVFDGKKIIVGLIDETEVEVVIEQIMNMTVQSTLVEIKAVKQKFLSVQRTKKGEAELGKFNQKVKYNKYSRQQIYRFYQTLNFNIYFNK